MTAVEVALTNVCVDVSDDTPTLTVNVFAVTASIVCHAPSDGSPTLGYVCCVALLSVAHVNVRELLAKNIQSPLING